MARRKGGLTELLDVASKLPWKAAVALVPISFLVFHLIAAGFAAVPHATTIADMGSVVIHQGIYTAATIFQYIVPFALLIGAAVSYVKRSRSIALFDEVQSDPNGNVAGLGWQDFERLVGEGFRHRGFQVTERGGAGPDGGVDLALARGHERFLVQCKQWRAQQVGVSVVRELYGPHPFRWTVSNLSFRPLIPIQRIPQRGLPPQAAEVQWLSFFLLFRLAATERKAPGATISVDPWGSYPPTSHD